MNLREPAMVGYCQNFLRITDLVLKSRNIKRLSTLRLELQFFFVKGNANRIIYAIIICSYL